MTRNFRISLSSILVVVVALALAGAASAAEYGTIKGRFIYKGQPKVEPIQPSKDTEYCSKHNLKTETVSVSPKGELQNVFVYLYTARGQKVDVHPDIKPSAEPKVLDNKGCRFEPHAMTLWTAEKLEIRNSDPGIGHNTNGQKLAANPKFNEQVTNGQPIPKEFSKSEPIPTEVACNVHPWMKAVVLIRDNPYMAVSGADGAFEIKNVPAGQQAFVIWHEAKGYLRDLPVGKAKADRRGQVKLDVKAGETLDLGDITVTPAILGQ